MRFLPLLLLVGGGTFLTLGDIALKKWAVGGIWSPYVIAMVFYFVGLNLFAFTLKEKNLAIASTILVTLNTVFLVLVSYFYFKEKFTLIQSIGIFLSVISVVLLEWES